MDQSKSLDEGKSAKGKKKGGRDNLPKVPKELLDKYARSENGVKVKRSATDKKLSGNLKRLQHQTDEAVASAARTEALLPEEVGFLVAEGMEKTYKFSQQEIRENVDLNTSAKNFELKLDQFGPYKIDYTRNGKFLVIAGRKGHLASFDWQKGRLAFEIHLKETLRDVCYLHNETMLAVAQKKHVYVYDKTGAELHSMRKHIDVERLEFLPYHFLLASVGNSGYLRYQDTSTGAFVAELRTKLGRCEVMAQNPYNAVMNLGHSNGVVTMWAPSVQTPLVKMLCHRGPVKAVAVDKGGYYMATAGLDAQLKIWDVRTFKPVHEYFTPTPAETLSISHTGLLAVGYGPHVAIWKDAFKTKQKSPYMTHFIPSQSVTRARFCPFEDVLGISHTGGFSSLIVPGAGEPNFDALEANPYETAKQRKEREVRQLLDKLQPDMITLNPDFIGGVERSAGEMQKEERKIAFEANHAKEGTAYTPFAKKRGKASKLKRYLNGQSNVIDGKREALREKLETERKEREMAKKREEQRKKMGKDAEEVDVFQRFANNKRKRV
ncbi:BING4CT-domain-containing protein [Gonapodya prolifera JEL478]|uniref:U three protein 7 n=1 Tax=Gonapodya prolifera (strain JEL478) TaxID=1344416 RepID=A0A139A1T6_GONPJ|nr:BING4CT-domain-containing protein [Gonapodya prolifera JEL478]|eukprot:KXS10732.1 BING4CT-domain-containing protein [Gonapodya prolifera JEL478]